MLILGCVLIAISLFLGIIFKNGKWPHNTPLWLSIPVEFFLLVGSILSGVYGIKFLLEGFSQ